MRHSKKVSPDDTSTPEAIESGSLEWFRSRAPLPLLLRAFFEVEQNRASFDLGSLDPEFMVENNTEFWDLITTAEMQAELFELFHPDDPNAKEIAARIRRLTGCQGRLGYKGE
jgi:hypothetical protein